MFHEISGYVWIITIWISKDRHICQQLAITFFYFLLYLFEEKLKTKKKTKTKINQHEAFQEVL